MMFRSAAVAAALLLALAACGGYDPAEDAEPGEAVTTTPADSPVVRGAAEPGPQWDND